MGVERAGAGHRGGRMRGEQGEAGVLRGGRGSADMTFTGVSLFRAITMISITMISYTIMHLLNLKVLAKLLTSSSSLWFVQQRTLNLFPLHLESFPVIFQHLLLFS